VNNRTIQRIVRPLSEEQASVLGFRALGTYDALSAVLRLPLSGALSSRSNEHAVVMEVWAELDSGKTVLPCEVVFEPHEIPAVRFRLPIPAASKPVALAIAIRSSPTGHEFDASVRSAEPRTSAARPSDVISEELGKSTMPDKSPPSA
jgi:hypothetical protein